MEISRGAKDALDIIEQINSRLKDGSVVDLQQKNADKAPSRRTKSFKTTEDTKNRILNGAINNENKSMQDVTKSELLKQKAKKTISRYVQTDEDNNRSRKAVCQRKHNKRIGTDTFSIKIQQKRKQKIYIESETQTKGGFDGLKDAEATNKKIQDLQSCIEVMKMEQREMIQLLNQSKPVSLNSDLLEEIVEEVVVKVNQKVLVGLEERNSRLEKSMKKLLLKKREKDDENQVILETSQRFDDLESTAKDLRSKVEYEEERRHKLESDIETLSKENTQKDSAIQELSRELERNQGKISVDNLVSKLEDLVVGHSSTALPVVSSHGCFSQGNSMGLHFPMSSMEPPPSIPSSQVLNNDKKISSRNRRRHREKNVDLFLEIVEAVDLPIEDVDKSFAICKADIVEIQDNILKTNTIFITKKAHSTSNPQWKEVRAVNLNLAKLVEIIFRIHTQKKFGIKSSEICNASVIPNDIISVSTFPDVFSLGFILTHQRTARCPARVWQ